MDLSRVFVFLLLLLSGPIWAADFCVNTSDDLQQALSAAAANSQDDDIRVVQGTYDLHPSTFTGGEQFALALSGGWDPKCLAPERDPLLTRLEAINKGAALLTFSAGNASSSIENLTFSNGTLVFKRTANVTLSGVSIVADDRDGDGVNDFVDEYPDDPNEQFDTDKDGIPNNQDPDDDNDDMPDTYENLNGLDPLLDDRDLDLDDDGYSNFEEFELGTAPDDATDVPLSSPSWLMILPAILDK